MSELRDRILVIDHDPDELAILVEGVLIPSGRYEVETASDGMQGLSLALANPPDLLVLDLNLRGLDGQSVLAALSARSIEVSTVVLADSDQAAQALNAFRLGAKDCLIRPFRETEFIQVIERVLRDVRFQRERERLAEEIRQAAGAAEQHLRELKILMGIGKSVTSLRRPDDVFDLVIRAAVYVTRAESAGLFLWDERNQSFIVRAGHNLSRNLAERMGQAIQDDLAQHVMNTQEPYMVSGEELRQFPSTQQGAEAVIYAPLVVNEQAFGTLWVANSQLTFEPHMKDIMSALADYAAIAIFNARLFVAMTRRTKQLEQMYQQLQAQQEVESRPSVSPTTVSAMEQGSLARLRGTFAHLLDNMNLFRTGQMGPLPPQHQAAVDVMHRQLQELVDLVDRVVQPEGGT